MSRLAVRCSQQAIGQCGRQVELTTNMISGIASSLHPHQTSRYVSTATLHRPACGSVLTSHPLSVQTVPRPLIPSQYVVSGQLGRRTVTSFSELTRHDRKRMKAQRKGNTVFLPEFIAIRDLAHRLHVPVLAAHKAGSTFFEWWPRASERQLKRDGYAMLSDLVLRFDESARLVSRLGYDVEYEHLGIEAIREAHYAYQRHRAKKGSDKVKPGPCPLEERSSYHQPKQPVVCILGHVDHGKTTLLDTLRGTAVARHETAGITQDLYMFQVNLPEQIVSEWSNEDSLQAKDDEAPITREGPLADVDAGTLLSVYNRVTFLDTPGHVGFFDIRENATHFADLAVLVVSAVEGIDAQTLEAIDYIKTFKCPAMVVITKCDLPNAKPETVMKGLRALGVDARMYNEADAFSRLIPETTPSTKNKLASLSRLSNRSKYGIDNTLSDRICPTVFISAVTGMNMDNLQKSLLRAIMTIKPVCDLDAPPCALVLDAFNDEGGRGKVLRVLLSSGTIAPRDFFVSGIFYGRVRDVRSVAPPEVSALHKNDKSGEGIGTRLGRGVMGPRLALALPGVPIDVSGCEGIPQAGDDLRVIPEQALTRAISDVRRLALDYESQSRFTLGGDVPPEWEPPKYGDDMVIRADSTMTASKPLDRLRPELAIIEDLPDEEEEEEQEMKENEGEDIDDEESRELRRARRRQARGREDEGDRIRREVAEKVRRREEAEERALGEKRKHERMHDVNNEVESGDEEGEEGKSRPNWNVMLKSEGQGVDERFVIIKAGSMSGLRMAMDSIAAYNARNEHAPISVYRAGVGTLSRDDVLRAQHAEAESGAPCPVVLFRTRGLTNAQRKLAQDEGVMVQEYTKYDDMLADIVGQESFTRHLSNAKSLRLVDVEESVGVDAIASSGVGSVTVDPPVPTGSKGGANKSWNVGGAHGAVSVATRPRSERQTEKMAEKLEAQEELLKKAAQVAMLEERKLKQRQIRNQSPFSTGDQTRGESSSLSESGRSLEKIIASDPAIGKRSSRVRIRVNPESLTQTAKPQQQIHQRDQGQEHEHADDHQQQSKVKISPIVRTPAMSDSTKGRRVSISNALDPLLETVKQLDPVKIKVNLPAGIVGDATNEATYRGFDVEGKRDDHDNTPLASHSGVRLASLEPKQTSRVKIRLADDPGMALLEKQKSSGTGLNVTNIILQDEIIATTLKKQKDNDSTLSSPSSLTSSSTPGSSGVRLRSLSSDPYFGKSMNNNNNSPTGSSRIRLVDIADKLPTVGGDDEARPGTMQGGGEFTPRKANDDSNDK